MNARDGSDCTQRQGGRRTARPRRGPLAATLPALFILCCLLGPVAAAGAVPAQDSAQALLAGVALQQFELTAGDGGAGDELGLSVAVSGDTALVGAPRRDTGGQVNAGAAYVFKRFGGSWMQQQMLIAVGGAADDEFGTSVAIFGETALVGAPRHATAGQAGAGAAYVFVRSAGVWTQQAQLSAAGGAAGDGFGVSVALSGETALIGAPLHAIGGQAAAGAAHVFTRFGGVWHWQAQLTAADGVAGDLFGRSVALSGETALVGAPLRDTAGHVAAGAAYVFTRSAGSWTQQAKPIADDSGDEDYFGISVALSGETALVGAAHHDTAGKAKAGAAYVFVRSGGVWARQAHLAAGDGAADDGFGWSVALAGETALVGAAGHDTAMKAEAGAAYIFTRSGAAWTQQAQPIADNGAAGDGFGESVALSEGTALVGAPYHDTAGKHDAGSVYAFVTTPSVTSFLPAAGPVGTAVTLTGTGFTGVTAVRFNGVAAAFNVVSAKQITATVPLTATTGRIAVTTPIGSGTSLASFTVIPAPVITSFLPAAGPVGTIVALTGTGFTGATAVVFNGTAATVFSVVSDVAITATVPAAAITGTIAVTTPGGSAASATSFSVIPAPVITSFLPAAGPVGTDVTLTGTGFSGATAVVFNGTAATVFSVVSDVAITATVPAAAITGTIAVTTPGGSAASAASFTVIPGPVIASFLPAAGPVGTAVTLTGTGFSGATAVTFGGGAAAASFSVVSDAQITATVPAAATTGKIAVTTPGGSAASAASFTVIPAPVIASFLPAAGPVGTIVALTGTGFTGATAVTFGGGAAAASFSVVSDAQITATVPAGATSGTIAVTTPGGSAASAASFTVIPAPVITKLKPAAAKRRATVTITGTGFGAARGAGFVKFGAKKCATYLSWSNTRIKCKVPAKARYGKVRVTVTTAAGASNARRFKVKR